MAILIADSGSTKTDWVLLNNNHIILQTQTIGFNPYFQTNEIISNEITSQLIPLLKSDLNSITHIAYYGAGCSTLDKINILKNALHDVFGNIQIDVNHDLLAAARALCGKEKGIACILGTGSNSCLYDGVTITENVPSVGYLFGDFGSGAHIGKTFIQYYFDKELPTNLKNEFEKAGYDREFILENVYKKHLPSKFLANVSSFMSNYSDDDFVKKLIVSCFETFFKTQISQYTNSKELPIQSVGSIAYYYKQLLEIAAKNQGYSIGSIIKSPIEGLIKYHS